MIEANPCTYSPTRTLCTLVADGLDHPRGGHTISRTRAPSCGPGIPNYIPKFKRLTGQNPAVARYIRCFPQTVEFTKRITELLLYLLPYYIREGKSYLTISFGCTGGRHRSVMIAEEINRNLRAAGFKVKLHHRDAVQAGS
ncbi:MAG: hypothetical protein ACLQVN_25045 [Bryobacteraceae bacterium]